MLKMDMEDKRDLQPKQGIRNFEEVFDRTTHYGRYQLFMLLVIQYAMINAAGNYLFTSFGGLYKTCDDPVYRLEAVKDVCVMVQNCPANASHSEFFSLYEDDDFVCPNSGLPQHLQSLQAIGSGLGALIGGHVADTFGRKWVSYAGALQMTAFGLLGAVAPSWSVLAFAMLGMGFSYGVLVDSSMTLASETVGSKYRIVQTLAFQWSLAMQVSALVAYLTASWRTYLIVINVIAVPVLFFVPMWVESPRWLIQKRRYKQAAESLNVMSRWNRNSHVWTAEDLKGIDLDRNETKVFSVWHLFSTKKLFLYSCVMILSALTVETAVAVIIFDVQTLAGNPFMNIALYGLLRLWVPLFIFLMEKNSASFGRRMLFCGSQALTTVFFVLFLVFPSSLSCSLAIKTTLAMAAGILNSSIFFTVYKQYSIELYPTLMRAMAVGAFGVVERIGGALAPQLVHLSRTTFWSGFAIAVATAMTASSLVAGWAILPETKRVAMPDVSGTPVELSTTTSDSGSDQ